MLWYCWVFSQSGQLMIPDRLQYVLNDFWNFDLLEVPEIIQKVLQYFRESKLAIWGELKPKKNLLVILKTRTTTKRLKCLPYFGPVAWLGGPVAF